MINLKVARDESDEKDREGKNRGEGKGRLRGSVRLCRGSFGIAHSALNFSIHTLLVIGVYDRCTFL